MIIKDKVTEIFCIIDEFDKNLSAELAYELVFCLYSILLLWEQTRGTAGVYEKIKAVGTLFMLNLSRSQV